MTPAIQALPETDAEIIYPDSDGKPMADNQKQFRCIHRLYYGIAGLLRERRDVLVVSDLLWYPRRGDNKFALAPDVMVAFGRPQRFNLRSYLQWLEGDVCPQFGVEVLSHTNTRPEMDRKRLDYEELGVQEYVQYDPESNELEAYRRGPAGGALVRFAHSGIYESKLLPIRFETRSGELEVFGPDGERFLLPEEAAEQTVLERLRLATERERADLAQRQRDDAQKQRDDAQKQRDDAQKQRDDAQYRAQRLAALAGRLLDGTATPEEMDELRRLRTP